MLIGIYLSTHGGSPLQVGMERGFPKIGVNVEYFQANRPYDYVLVFNQCAHTLAYHYPNLQDLHPYKIAFIDTAEYGWIHRRPQEANLYYSTFAEGAMNHDTKVKPQQQNLFNFLKDKGSFPYFIREYLKCFKYPEMYHPIDYPLYLHSECHQPPNREQYLARHMDLFLSWGASHPFRLNITKLLRESNTKYEVSIIEEVVGGKLTPRMPQEHYFEKTQDAKVGISYDGYGSGSFREMEVLCRTLLLKGETAIIQRNALTHGVNCLEFKVTTSEDGCDFIDSNVVTLLKEYLQKPEESFEIYKRGYEHCMQHFTEAKTAQYVLDTILAHDYSKPTPLRLVTLS